MAPLIFLFKGTYILQFIEILSEVALNFTNLSPLTAEDIWF